MNVNNINTSLSLARNDLPTAIKSVCLTGDKDTSVFAIELAPNEFIPAHYHQIGIEIYFILSGEGVLYLGHLAINQLIWDHKIKVKEGDCFSIEPNQVHKFENNSDQKLRLIGIAPFAHSTDEDRFFVRHQEPFI